LFAFGRQSFESQQLPAGFRARLVLNMFPDCGKKLITARQNKRKILEKMFKQFFKFKL
jgi:hypothetical protein